jgi:hypothetical protein
VNARSALAVIVLVCIFIKKILYRDISRCLQREGVVLSI